MLPGFDLEKYLRNSKKVDVSDLDFSEAKRYPVTPGEIRCLTYMMDVEAHTVAYLRAILNTCAIEDPETTAFLSCWSYEEFFHGWTLRQFLETLGVGVAADRMADVQRRASFRDWLKNLGSSFVCQVTRHFHAVYLTYGAISELSTLEGYGVMAKRTANPILSELLERLAKDERRHFSFYYNKAKAELEPRNAQRLAKVLLQRFWEPVGGGVKADPEVDWVLGYILGDAEGEQVAGRIDATIAKLPGMQWFDGLRRSRRESLERLRRAGASFGLEAAQSTA